MAQSWAESTWEITNYERFINQFPPNIVRSIRQFERINKKYVDKNVYLFNQIYIYIYIYIRGAFNKYPDIFYIGIQNRRRLLKIPYVIAIHLLR